MHEMYCSLGYLIDVRVFCFCFLCSPYEYKRKRTQNKILKYK